MPRVNDVQRDYYRVTSAGSTFEQRLEAIRAVLIPGSRIVDLGCNDGRFSRALLESGHASSATGIDLEDILAGGDSRLRFVKADLRETGASVVPEADAILCLNVLHHLLLEGPDFVRAFLADLLRRAETVLVDLGSLTERGPWPWRQLMERFWSSDEEVAGDLFSVARWRRPLCAYVAQGGRRVLWKLSGRPPSDYEFELEQRYRRMIGMRPERKRLVPVADDEEVPPLCTPEVIFFRLRRRETEERFWAKRYLGPRAVPWRRATELEVSAFVRAHEPAASLPIDERDDFGAIYPFDEDLFTATAIHYHDRHLLPVRDRRRYERLMTLLITGGAFAGLPVGLVTDPQAIVTPAGVTFVDFEPNHQYTDLVRYVQGATPAQRFEILSAFYDVNPTFTGSYPPAVQREIRLALGTVLFCEIARERLRVQRNRFLRRGLGDLFAGRPLGPLRSAVTAIRTEVARTRRKVPLFRVSLKSALARFRRSHQLS